MVGTNAPEGYRGRVRPLDPSPERESRRAPGRHARTSRARPTRRRPTPVPRPPTDRRVGRAGHGRGRCV